MMQPIEVYMTKDCTNCGWGVRWEYGAWDGELMGVCQWVPPVPFPPVYGLVRRFCERSTPEQKCPVWKPVQNGKVVPRWCEPRTDFCKRLRAHCDAQISQIEEEYSRTVAGYEADPVGWQPPKPEQVRHG